LVRADRPCELLQDYEYESHATVAAYGNMLRTKADLHTELGQHTLAMATLRHAADVYLSAQRKGLLKASTSSIGGKSSTQWEASI